MEILIEILILAILILIMITLFVDEKRLKSVTSPSGKVTEYWDGTERRKSIRIKASIRAAYTIDKKSGQKRNAIGKNISSGGMLMQANEKLSVPTPLLLDIFLPNEEKSVAAKGKVVWVEEVPNLDEVGKRLFDTGIKFISMSLKDKERLERQLEELS